MKQTFANRQEYMYVINCAVKSHLFFDLDCVTCFNWT